MDAQISITGNVGTEVEVRATRNQQPMATFRVACTPRYRASSGEWTDTDTTWMTVRCYRWLAENVATSLRKGDPVVVVGRLRTSVWNDDKGVRHERAEIDAASVGHDLTRGTTHFRRSDRPATEAAGTGEQTGDPDAGSGVVSGDPWVTPSEPTGEQTGAELDDRVDLVPVP